MSTVSDLLGASAAPTTFTHADRTYTVSLVSQRVKSAVEKWLRAVAYADLYELRDVMPADQYREALALIGKDRGRFAYMGEAFWDEMRNERGGIAMTAILFGCSEDEARALTTERAADVSALVSEAILASMPREQAEMARKRMKDAEEKAKRGEEAPNPTAPA